MTYRQIQQERMRALPKARRKAEAARRRERRVNALRDGHVVYAIKDDGETYVRLMTDEEISQKYAKENAEWRVRIANMIAGNWYSSIAWCIK